MSTLTSETASSEAQFEQAETPGKILIVDDLADNRAVLSRRFARRGFATVEAENGEQALEFIERDAFDVVLLDVMMPGLSGNDVLRVIREKHEASLLPVIMVTARSQSEDIVESLQLGANDYVTKPVDFAVALARVNNQIARRRSEVALRNAKRRLETRFQERNEQLWEANSSLSQEVARRMAQEDRIAYLAHFDVLTGLANRFQFETRLHATLAETSHRRQCAVMFLDLDGFKSVNDTLGHSIGDALLRAVARAIRAGLGPDDFAARFGGDEFVVVHVSADPAASAPALAERLIATIAECRTVESHQVFVGASVGIAYAQDPSTDAADLMKRADLAMYQAKAAGRGRSCVFRPEMGAIAQNRRSLEIALREALAHGQFELFYQPIVDVKRRRLAGFEALLRWRHPERGVVTPPEFISLAEETGVIVPVGEWVIRHACLEAARWPDNLRLAVNLSPIQLRNKDLASIVIGALAASGLAPKRLELEITESVLLDPNSEWADVLSRLREIGVRVSLDDFGSGFSGLGYLRSLQFDKLKIDKSFVQEMEAKGESLAIVRAAVGLGASLGISTTAEGVETRDQLRNLSLEECTEVQGFLFGSPQPVHLLPALIERLNREIDEVFDASA